MTDKKTNTSRYFYHYRRLRRRSSSGVMKLGVGADLNAKADRAATYVEPRFVLPVRSSKARRSARSVSELKKRDDQRRTRRGRRLMRIPQLSLKKQVVSLPSRSNIGHISHKILRVLASHRAMSYQLGQMCASNGDGLFAAELQVSVSKPFFWLVFRPLDPLYPRVFDPVMLHDPDYAMFISMVHGSTLPLRHFVSKMFARKYRIVGELLSTFVTLNSATDRELCALGLVKAGIVPSRPAKQRVGTGRMTRSQRRKRLRDIASQRFSQSVSVLAKPADRMLSALRRALNKSYTDSPSTGTWTTVWRRHNVDRCLRKLNGQKSVSFITRHYVT
jgi:hypothetical protein